MQVNEKRLLDRLLEMIAIDSVSYEEKPMSDFLETYFKNKGLEVYRGSLAAYCGENRRLDGDPEYLRRHSLLQIAGCSLRTLACAADRSLFERPSGLPDVTGQYFAHTHR